MSKQEQLAGYFHSIACLAQEAADRLPMQIDGEDDEFFRVEYLEYIEGDIGKIKALLDEGEVGG